MNIDLTPIQRIANEIVELYRYQLQEANINASNTLSNTIKSVVELNDARLVVSLELEDYWKYVEYGRRAGKMPPIDAIAKWIKIKPVIPDPINGKVPDTRQLAFLIARKIGREGIEGRYPLRKAIYSDRMESVIEDIKHEIATQLKQQFINDVT